MRVGVFGIRLIAIFGIIALGLLPAGCGNQKTPVQGGIPEVAVVVVQHEQVELTTELPGRTSAFLIAEVRPQVNGIIQKRLFTEGGDVKAGDTLYQIDPGMYQAAYDNAKAALGRSEANLPSVRLRAERYKELVAVKAVSQQEYDDVSAALLQAEADVKYWKAMVESARINLGYTRVTAPISGRIGRSNVTVGALATAHQGPPFTTIQKLDQIYVDATQSSANLLRLKRSVEEGHIRDDSPDKTKVRLILEDGTEYPLEGSLKFSDVTVDPTTGSFIIRMVFPNPKQTLLPGMYVRALIQEGVVEKAVLVPQQGVSRDPKGNPVVLTVDAEGKVQPKQIAVDRAIGDKWLVSSGLSQGEKVIVEGSQRIRPGSSVKTVPFGADQKKDGPETDKTVQPPAKSD